MGVTAEIRRVAPRTPFTWAMPWGPIDPREAPGRTGSPLRPPYPDLVVASGRRAVPYVRAVKRFSGGRTFTAILKDPRTGAGAADLIWVPEHDRLRGPNVVVTLTSPHRASAAALSRARCRSDPRLAALPTPRAAILVGGDSRHARFDREDGRRLVGQLEELAEVAALMVTTSRRTPTTLRDALDGLVRRRGGFLWDGRGDNPHKSLLALADAIVVTADSANMLSEAVATGAPVLVFEPAASGRRVRAFVAGLAALGAVRPFAGRLERFAYTPLDSTPAIADAIWEALRAHRAGSA